jgi:hypothetical protein
MSFLDFWIKGTKVGKELADYSKDDIAFFTEKIIEKFKSIEDFFDTDW